MARITSWGRFVDALAPFVALARPLESMERAGLHPGGAIARALKDARPPRPCAPEFLARLQQTYGAPPPIRAFIARPPIDPPTVSSSGFALTASTDLSFLNAILYELWRVGTIPHQFDPDQTAQITTLEQLKALCTGVPDDASLGQLQIGIPDVSASSVSPRNIHLHVTCTLPLISETTSALLLVDFGLEVPLDFQVLNAQVRLSLDAIENISGTLHIGGFSSLQPRSEEARRTLEAAFVMAARSLIFFLRSEILSFKGSIFVQKKRYPNSTINITQVGAVTVQRPDGQTIILGLNVEKIREINPDQLVNLPLPHPPHTIHTIIDQDFASDALSSVISSGDLADFINRVKDRHSSGLNIDDITVKSGRVDFLNDELRVTIDCVMVDACPFGKDLSFTATVSGTPTIADGTLTIVTSDIDFDLDNTDAFLCSLLGAIYGPIGIIINVGVLAFLAAYNPSASDLNIPVAETSAPLPGSDKVVDLELTQATMTPQVLTSDGQLQLITDPLRVYVYLRIIQGFTPETSFPLIGGTVDLYEFDSPAPVGDDVRVPNVGMTEKFTKTSIITREVTYSPSADELLGSEVTDKAGRVTFVVVCNATAGESTVTTLIQDIHTEQTVSHTVQHRTIAEALPDLGVSIRSASGELLTSRRLIGLNVTGKRFGQFDHPVEVRVRRIPPILG